MKAGGDKLKNKAKQINNQKTTHPTNRPDAAAGMGFECGWSHYHVVCHLLTWETHGAGETLRKSNVAGEIPRGRKERHAAPSYFVDSGGCITVVPRPRRGCLRQYQTN